MMVSARVFALGVFIFSVTNGFIVKGPKSGKSVALHVYSSNSDDGRREDRYAHRANRFLGNPGNFIPDPEIDRFIDRTDARGYLDRGMDRYGRQGQESGMYNYQNRGNHGYNRRDNLDRGGDRYGRPGQDMYRSDYPNRGSDRHLSPARRTNGGFRPIEGADRYGGRQTQDNHRYNNLNRGYNRRNYQDRGVDRYGRQGQDNDMRAYPTNGSDRHGYHNRGTNRYNHGLTQDNHRYNNPTHGYNSRNYQDRGADRYGRPGQDNYMRSSPTHGYNSRNYQDRGIDRYGRNPYQEIDRLDDF